jgi:hypothetical protein
MIANGNEKQLPQPKTLDREQRCPNCGATPRLRHKLLDVHTGRTVRLFECRCGKLVWDDSGYELDLR